MASEGQEYKKVVEQRGELNYGGMSLGSDGEETLARTIDSYNLQNVSYMKFDVQGSEPLAIYGARETIKRCKPAISYEFTEGSQFDPKHWLAAYAGKVGGLPDDVLNFDAQAFLKSLGYKLARTPGSVDKFWCPPGYAKCPAA